MFLSRRIRAQSCAYLRALRATKATLLRGLMGPLCDEHAGGRLYPPVYGEWLDVRTLVKAVLKTEAEFRPG